MNNNTSDTNTPPDILYHYTSQNGLLGIINENSIRATDILYLNDSTEYTYAFNLMHEKINELIKELPESISTTNGLLEPEIVRIKRNMLETIQNNLNILYELKALEAYDIFVFSLSEKADQLGQWRGYCPDGNGFCIGFNTTSLLKIMNVNGFELIECIYEKTDQIETITAILNTTLKELESIFNTEDKVVLNATKSSLERDAILELIETAPKFKDCSFREEKEWRFFIRIGANDKNIQYRAAKSMITPYLSIPTSKEKIRLPIERLIVGPTPHKDLSVSSAKSLLINNDLKDCEIVPSKIPYRAW